MPLHIFCQQFQPKFYKALEAFREYLWRQADQKFLLLKSFYMNKQEKKFHAAQTKKPSWANKNTLSLEFFTFESLWPN